LMSPPGIVCGDIRPPRYVAGDEAVAMRPPRYVAGGEATVMRPPRPVAGGDAAGTIQFVFRLATNPGK